MPPCFAAKLKYTLKIITNKFADYNLIIKVFPLECDLYGKIIENAAIESLWRTNGYGSRTRVYKI